MSKIDPPRIRDAKDKPHHVFDWTVPATAAGTPLAIKGSLDYAPPPESSFNTLLLLPLVALALGGGTLWWVRRRRTSRP